MLYCFFFFFNGFITNYHNLSGLKQHGLIALVSKGRSSGPLSWLLSLCSHKALAKVLARLQPHLEAWLEKNLLGNSGRLTFSAPWALWLRDLASYWLSDGSSHQRLEATHRLLLREPYQRLSLNMAAYFFKDSKEYFYWMQERWNHTDIDTDMDIDTGRR
jgi:hypothetical protein